jgi:hypothetical protein
MTSRCWYKITWIAFPLTLPVVLTRVLVNPSVYHHRNCTLGVSRLIEESTWRRYGLANLGTVKVTVQEF